MRHPEDCVGGAESQEVAQSALIVLYELRQAQAERPECDEPAVLLVHASGQDPGQPR